MGYEAKVFDIPGESAGDEDSPFVCLIADDDQGDVLLTRKAMASLGEAYRVYWVTNGRDLLALLADPQRRDEIDLVLLDLNMPLLDGRDVLRSVQGNPDRCRVPIVVHTTSANQDDINFAYAVGANAYVSKNPDFAGYRDDVSRLMKFWRHTARIPKSGKLER